MKIRTMTTTIALAAGLALGGGAVLAHGAGDTGTGRNMMGPGMMGTGMMGHGMMGSGMMGRGMMSQGMTHPCMMGAAMRGPMMMGYDMHGQGMMGMGMHGAATMGGGAGQDLSTDDVRKMLERHLAWLGNDRLKLGEVKQKDDDIIVADIVTIDDSLVRRLEFNRHGGIMHRMH